MITAKPKRLILKPISIALIIVFSFQQPAFGNALGQSGSALATNPLGDSVILRIDYDAVVELIREITFRTCMLESFRDDPAAQFGRLSEWARQTKDIEGVELTPDGFVFHLSQEKYGQLMAADGQPLSTAILVALPLMLGTDGSQYKIVFADQTHREDSDRRLAELYKEIASEGRQIAATQGPVAGAAWLLNKLIAHSNCSDPLFRANMPAHMQEMADITRLLASNRGVVPSPELLIASMLHDADRFLDGYYVRVQDEPPIGSPHFNNYSKPIQHPRMAADFARPLLAALGIDEGITDRVHILIRNHESGIAPATQARLMAEGRFRGEDVEALVGSAAVLKGADSVSQFTPGLLTNSFNFLRSGSEFREIVGTKLRRCCEEIPEALEVIDEIMEARRAEFSQLAGGDEAYRVFLSVREGMEAAEDEDLAHADFDEETPPAPEAAVFKFGKVEEVHPGIQRATVKFGRGNKAAASGRLVILDPRRLALRQKFYPAYAAYDFYHYAQTPQMADELKTATGRDITFRKLPGKTLDEFVSEAGRDVLFASHTSQGLFWDPNTFQVIDGAICTKTAPGMLVQEDRVIPLNGPFYLFVIDGGKLGARIIHMVNGVPEEDISDVKEGIAGPPLVLDGKEHVIIEQARPAIGGTQVNWNPETTKAAFSALGLDKEGNILFLSLAGDPNAAEEVSVWELAEAMVKAGAVQAVLLGGGIDVGQFLRGDSVEFVRARSHASSTTGKYFESVGGRPLPAILYATPKQSPSRAIAARQSGRTAREGSTAEDEDLAQPDFDTETPSKPEPAVFEFGERQATRHAGIERQAIKFRRDSRAAEGRLVRIDPRRASVTQRLYEECLNYDFYHFAQTPELAEHLSGVLGRKIEFKTFPGKTVPQFVQEETGSTIFAVNGSQWNFYSASSFNIIDGKIYRRTAPSMMVNEDRVLPLNGDFYILVLEGARLGMRKIRMVNDVPDEDLSDIRQAIAGPPLVLEGEENVIIEEGRPSLTGIQVPWDPKTVRAAFSALGIDKDGNILQLSMAGNPAEAEELSVYEMADAMRRAGAIGAILIGGSLDVQQYLGGDTEEFLVAGAHSRSATGAYDRPLANILYIKAKPVQEIGRGLVSTAQASGRTAREGSSASLRAVFPRTGARRNLAGEIKIENGKASVRPTQKDQEPDQLLSDFTKKVIPRSRILSQLIGSGQAVSIRITENLGDGARTTAGGRVIKIDAFLARALVSGPGIARPPVALLDLALQNEVTHRAIQQHLPRSRTAEEDFVIEVMATLEELKSAFLLSPREKTRMARWLNSPDLTQRARTNIDEFFELIDVIGSVEDVYTSAGLTSIALHVAKTHPALREFADIEKRTQLPVLICSVLERFLGQAEFPYPVGEQLASVIEAHTPPADLASRVRFWSPAAKELYEADTYTADEVASELAEHKPSVRELQRARQQLGRKHTGEEFDFPEPVDMASVTRSDIRRNIGTTGTVLFAAGEGTRLLGQLKLIRGAKDETSLLALFERLGIGREDYEGLTELWQSLRAMPDAEFALLAKPTVPLVGERSPLQVDLETLAEINKEYGADRPVLIVVSEATRKSVEELLEKNKNFGLRNIALVEEDANPVVTSQDGHFLVIGGALRKSPKGTAGALEALANKPHVRGGRKGRHATAMEWLESLGTRNLIALNGDMVTPKDYMLALAGADREADVVALSYDYPRERKSGTREHLVKVGTHVLVTDKITGRRRLVNIEHAERKSHEGLIAAIDKAEKEEKYISGNPGGYRFSLALLRDTMGTLKIHVAANKDEELAQFGDGTFLKVDKYEEFAPDLIERGKRPLLLSGRYADLTPIKNSVVLVAEHAKYRKAEEEASVMSAFNRFQSGFIATPDNCTITRLSTGHINPTYLLEDKRTGRKFIVQTINPIFDAEAIDYNLQLLELAQTRAHEQGILPAYWQDVSYLNVAGSSSKIHRDATGLAWRVMDFIEYDTGQGEGIFYIVDEIRDSDRTDAARSLGAGIAIFGRTLDTVKPEIESGALQGWKEPLPHFHDHGYHKSYLDAILRGEQVALSLSRAAHPPTVSRQDEVVRGYENGPARAEELQRKIEQRSHLVTGLDALGSGVTHGDTKLSNAVFRRDQANALQCVCLIDLDTVQVGNVLDDLGDALRFAGNPAGEEPRRIGDVRIDTAIVNNIIDGYIGKMREFYGPERSNALRRHAITALKLFFYEQCIRFFADSLVGNEYYKLNPNERGYRPDLNLYRAEVQMRALEELERIEGIGTEELPQPTVQVASLVVEGREIEEGDVVEWETVLGGFESGVSAFEARRDEDNYDWISHNVEIGFLGDDTYLLTADFHADDDEPQILDHANWVSFLLGRSKVRRAGWLARPGSSVGMADRFDRVMQSVNELPDITEPVVIVMDFDWISSTEEERIGHAEIDRRIDEFVEAIAAKGYNIRGFSFAPCTPMYSPKEDESYIRQKLAQKLQRLFGRAHLVRRPKAVSIGGEIKTVTYQPDGNAIVEIGDKFVLCETQIAGDEDLAQPDFGTTLDTEAEAVEAAKREIPMLAEEDANVSLLRATAESNRLKQFQDGRIGIILPASLVLNEIGIREALSALAVRGTTTKQRKPVSRFAVFVETADPKEAEDIEKLELPLVTVALIDPKANRKQRIELMIRKMRSAGVRVHNIGMVETPAEDVQETFLKLSGMTAGIYVGIPEAPAEGQILSVHGAINDVVRAILEQRKDRIFRVDSQPIQGPSEELQRNLQEYREATAFLKKA